MAFAETVDGVAEITLGAAAEPGPLEVGARVAGSVVARSARAAFAPPRFLTATFNLVNAVGVGALSIDVPFPAGAAPIEGEDGVVLELLLGTNAPPDEGIANAATLVIGNRVEGVNIVSVGVITLQPIDGSGAFFRMSFQLPPGAEFDCDSLQPVFFRASDGISQIPGVDFVCDHVTRSARGQPNRE